MFYLLITNLRKNIKSSRYTA